MRCRHLEHYSKTSAFFSISFIFWKGSATCLRHSASFPRQPLPPSLPYHPVTWRKHLRPSSQRSCAAVARLATGRPYGGKENWRWDNSSLGSSVLRNVREDVRNTYFPRRLWYTHSNQFVRGSCAWMSWSKSKLKKHWQNLRQLGDLDALVHSL